MPSPTDDAIEPVKVLGLRRNIAERMAASKRKIPHFTYVEEVDVTELERLRAELNLARRRATEAVAAPVPDARRRAAPSRHTPR